MPSDRFSEFLKTASQELKDQIATTGEKVTRTTPDKLQHADDATRPYKGAEKANGEPPKMSERIQGHLDSVKTEPHHQRRIDQAMSDQSKAQAAKQGKEATKSGASIEESKAPTPPAKEPER